MALLSSVTVLRLVESAAILLSQTYQLARARLASADSPILRLLVRRDQDVTEADLLRREVEILRAQREGLQSHRGSMHKLRMRPAWAPQLRPSERLNYEEWPKIGWAIGRATTTSAACGALARLLGLPGVAL